METQTAVPQILAHEVCRLKRVEFLEARTFLSCTPTMTRPPSAFARHTVCFRKESGKIFFVPAPTFELERLGLHVRGRGSHQTVENAFDARALYCQAARHLNPLFALTIG